MPAYYNDHEPFVQPWLRNLAGAGLIAPGLVDPRSITEVRPSDVDSATQAHFFAGIGGWSHALRLADWPDDVPVWTGSCPCQPFSVAGRRRGTDDHRHLWPEWRRLIAECGPPILFGEQVASPDGRAWLAAVFADLEALGYAVAGADLCAAGVGAPHLRQRLYFAAITHDQRRQGLDALLRGRRPLENRPETPWGGEAGGVGHADGRRAGRDSGGVSGAEAPGGRSGGASRSIADGVDVSGAVDGVADANRRQRGRVADGEGRKCDRPSPKWDKGHSIAEPSGTIDRVADADECAGRQGRALDGGRDHGSYAIEGPGPGGSFWTDCDWLPCLDGKARPAEPGTFPLADGVPARVGRLRAYGNAIVPELAATFIASVMDLL